MSLDPFLGGADAPVEKKTTANPFANVGTDDASEAMQRVTIGVVYAPDDKPDYHGDVIAPETLEQAAWDALGCEVGINHQPGTAGAGKVVESFIYRGEKFSMRDVGGETQTILPGSWILAVQWAEGPAWEAVKSGKINGYSLQGMARKDPAKKSAAGDGWRTGWLEKAVNREAPTSRMPMPGITVPSFSNVVFGVSHAVFDFPIEGQRETFDDKAAKDNPADRAEQESQARRMAEWMPDAEPNLRGRRARAGFDTFLLPPRAA